MKGLGDLVAAITSAVGIKPCGGCKGRQETLNRAVPFGDPVREFEGDFKDGVRISRRTAARGLRMLRHRDVNQLQQFHLALSQNRILCLDFNRWFDNLDEFNRWVVPAVKSLQPGDLIVGVPTTMWEQFADQARFPMIALYALPSEIATSRGVRNVVVCQGEFV